VQASASGELYALEVNEDKYGELIEVQHQWHEGDQYGYSDSERYATTPENPDKQPGTVTVLKPALTISFSQLESTTHATLLARYKTYIGKLNTAEWLLDSTTTAGLWMFTNMAWTTSAVAANDTTDRIFEVTYTFQWRAEGWAQRVVYINPHTGRPAPNPVLNVDYKDINLYDLISFGSLPLSWSNAV